MIGSNTEKIVANLKPEKEADFGTIIDIFAISCDYIIQKFPIDDEIFVNTQVPNINTIDKESFSKVFS